VGDCDYATRWMLINAGFSRRIAKDEWRNESRIAKGERGIWQRRYWEHLVRDESDYEKHVDYVDYNPAKHGYVERVSEWPHSTFHRYWLEAYIRPIGRVCMDSNWKRVNVRESLRWESFVIPTGR
jgi:putative transposase